MTAAPRTAAPPAPSPGRARRRRTLAAPCICGVLGSKVIRIGRQVRE
uniref:Uncharacterized protein n=1 Tax=Arundo donax TaxID=35708 RepID=A0A0A8YCL1_ARUDO